MKQRVAAINLSDGTYTDVETGKVYPSQYYWQKWSDSQYMWEWREINRQASPTNDLEYNLPVKVSRDDLRYGLYNGDHIIKGRTQGLS